MINLCYVLIILLVALMIKLYLDSNKSKNNFNNINTNNNNNTNNNTNNKNNNNKNSNTNSNTSYDLDADPDFKKLLEKIKTDTESKINMAVEEGFSDGYQAMLEQDNYNTNDSDSDNIVSYLNKTSSIKLMLFYKSECPYCKEFMPVWNRIINNLPNNVKYEEIDCNKQTKKANEYNISSVPTIILLVNNEKKIYMGDRSYNDITRFIRVNGVNLVERTFEQFDSTGYSTDPAPTLASNPHCPAVTFDKQSDIANDSYMFQIFNADGQYGYATGGYKDGSTLSPFTAAYSVVDSYLSSLPLPVSKDTTKGALGASTIINECASLYSNQIRNFELCDKDKLDDILKYQTNVANGSGQIIFDGTDYSSNNVTVKAIKNACML